MSFSVRCDKSGLEYNGESLNRLFAQRRNLLYPPFYRMIRDIRRFYRESPTLLGTAADTLTLGEYLTTNRYSKTFVDQHIVPMAAAIWSANPQQMLEFPARYFVQFFHNHGFLQVRDRPCWRVVTGGSQRYVDRLIQPYRDCLRLRCPVRGIRRDHRFVDITGPDGEHEQYDRVVLATHSDQALALLQDPSQAEREVLGAIRYQRNEAVLHTDRTLLPRRQLAWAGWNYHIVEGDSGVVAVTYNLNILQRLRAPVQFCVTLNRTEMIDPARVIRRLTYDHPVYTAATLAAQRRHAEINGVNRTYFCGAYWGYGFHEDGVNSALVVGQQFGQALDGATPIARPAWALVDTAPTPATLWHDPESVSQSSHA